MRIHIIACRVLTRELSALVPNCPNSVDVSWMPQGMHDTPSVLHESLIDQLERIYNQIERRQLRRKPDYIVMGYGLCSKATVGLEAKEIPLVIPRTEDCIALFLGSQERYMKYFNEYPGTFWLTSDWVESLPDTDPDYMDQLREQYMEQYDGDEDTVEYLLDMERQSLANYNNVGFIETHLRDDSVERDVAKEFAKSYELNYMEFEGSNSMLKDIVAGNFDDERFLIVPPGYRTVYSNGPERIVAEKID